ncbi:unnamed protein product [marine sediment metagenome]|uniref:Uncharacterized protein n=1 Tax=marine sediment metagenome TaxID=412755 RepID=X1JEX8_9ZZZZ
MKLFDSIAKDLVRQKAREVEAEKVEAEKVEAEKADPELEIFTTKPMEGRSAESEIPPRKETRGRKPLPRIICPFCDEERKRIRVSTHILERHGVPGVHLSDLEDVAGGVKSLEDLVCEKFDKGAEINLRGLSDRCSKEEFGSWADVDLKAEAEADPGDADLKAEGNPGLKAEGNPGLKAEGNPGLKAEGNPGLKAEGNPGLKVERRRFNWIPFFSPFNRRSYRK